MKTYLALLILILTPIYFIGQNPVKLDYIKLKYTYISYFQPDSTDYKNIRDEKIILKIGQEISFSQSLNRYILDSIIENARDLSILSNMHMLPSNVFDFRIYKNHPTDKITTIERIFPDHYIYVEPMDVFRWEIYPDQQELFGYTTYRATTRYGGREWTAWFAPEIPISDGPYKFRGLPGLIIRIEDTKGHYKFELIEIAKGGEYDTIKHYPRDYIDAGRDGFFRAWNRHREESAASLRAFLINPDPETLRRMEQNHRRSNNPIELKPE